MSGTMQVNEAKSINRSVDDNGHLHWMRDTCHSSSSSRRRREEKQLKLIELHRTRPWTIVKYSLVTAYTKAHLNKQSSDKARGVQCKVVAFFLFISNHLQYALFLSLPLSLCFSHPFTALRILGKPIRALRMLTWTFLPALSLSLESVGSTELHWKNAPV